MSGKEELARRLAQHVVIADDKRDDTGAQSIAPEHSPRALHHASALPARSALKDFDLQCQAEQFLYHQAELLDGKHWQAYIDLFATDGMYWMPIAPEQTDWTDSPSIFAEDKSLMTIRMGRVTHPNAWSQAPMWGTHHMVGNVVIESVSEQGMVVRSRFQMMELRRDNVRHFGGSYRHTLERTAEDFRIKLQRVDMMNSQAPYDYVLQVWV
ncbi:MAG: aromatic-ring-hydroxylating dioxygenase subunit beta [Burkholderiales bacterium]